jgi:hypothetical protein
VASGTCNMASIALRKFCMACGVFVLMLSTSLFVNTCPLIASRCIQLHKQKVVIQLLRIVLVDWYAPRCQGCAMSYPGSYLGDGVCSSALSNREGGTAHQGLVCKWRCCPGCRSGLTPCLDKMHVCLPPHCCLACLLMSSNAIVSRDVLPYTQRSCRIGMVLLPLSSWKASER